MLLDKLSTQSVAGSIDAEAGIIYGVSVATVGPALGHGFQLSDKSINQIVSLGSKGDVRLKIGHGSKADPDPIVNFIGFLDNFRRVDAKVLADLHLTEAAVAHPRGDLRAYITAIAKETPSLAGLSVEIGYDLLDDDTADIKELAAVAVVLDPAANPNGLFSAKDINTDMESNLASINTKTESTTEYTESGNKTILDETVTIVDAHPTVAPLYAACDAINVALGTDGYNAAIDALIEVAITLKASTQAAALSVGDEVPPEAEEVVPPVEVAPEATSPEEIPPVADEIPELQSRLAAAEAELGELRTLVAQEQERRAKLATHRGNLAQPVEQVDILSVDHKAVWLAMLAKDPKAASIYYQANIKTP